MSTSYVQEIEREQKNIPVQRRESRNGAGERRTWASLRETEFGWWCLEFIGLLGFSVKSKRWPENSRCLAGRCLSKEGKEECAKVFAKYSKSGIYLKDRRGEQPLRGVVRALASDLQAPLHQPAKPEGCE